MDGDSVVLLSEVELEPRCEGGVCVQNFAFGGTH